MQIFKQPTFNEAINYINHLKKEIKYYPKHLSEYLNKNFFPEYRKYLRFLENDYINHLEPTNNKLENYSGNTMPRYEKKSYRTMKGLWSALMHKKDGWIKRRKQDLTNWQPLRILIPKFIYILINKYFFNNHIFNCIEVI